MPALTSRFTPGRFATQIQVTVRLVGLVAMVQMFLLGGILDFQAIAFDGPKVAVQRLENGVIQPQVVTSEAGDLHLITYRGDARAGDLWYQTMPANETEFQPAIQINSQPGSAIAAGSIRGGQVALGSNDRVHVVWNGSPQAKPRGPGKHDSPLLYSRLDSSRREFEAERDVIGSAHTLDGGSSVTAGPDGKVNIVWHAGQGGEENRRVWFRSSTDSGATFADARTIDGKAEGACGCCGLRATTDRTGNIYVLFRTAREKTSRDMKLLYSRDHGGTFSDLTVGHWNTNICPMSNAATAESKTTIALAWESEGVIEFTRVNKKTGEVAKVTRPSTTGQPRRLPALALSESGDLLVVWTEGTGWEKGGDVVWQTFDKSNRPTQKPTRNKGLPVWSFPAAWTTSNGEFRIIY